MNVPVDVKSILDNGEEIEYQCGDALKPRIASSILSTHLIYIVGVVVFAGLSLADTFTLPAFIDGEYVLAGVLAGVGLIGFVGWRAFQTSRTKRTYYVTDDKVVTFVDSPSKSTVSYVDLDTVQNIELRRGRFEKRFDSATLDISTQRGYDGARLPAIEPGSESELIEEVQARMGGPNDD